MYLYVSSSCFHVRRHACVLCMYNVHINCKCANQFDLGPTVDIIYIEVCRSVAWFMSSVCKKIVCHMM